VLAPAIYAALWATLIDRAEQAGLGARIEGDGDNIFVGIVLFADDTKILARDQEDMVALLELAGTYAQSVGARFGHAKCAVTWSLDTEADVGRRWKIPGLDEGTDIATKAAAVHLGLKTVTGGSWKPHFMARKGKWDATEHGKTGVVPMQRAQLLALNATTPTTRAPVMVWEAMAIPNVHLGAVPTAAASKEEMVPLRAAHRAAMHAITGGRTQATCAAACERTTGFRSAGRTRRRILALYILRVLELPEGHLARRILKAAREGWAMGTKWQQAAQEACEAAGMGENWAKFEPVRPKTKARESVRRHLDQVEEDEQEQEVRATSTMLFHRHVFRRVSHLQGQFAVSDGARGQFSTTAVVMLRQLRAGQARLRKYDYKDGQRVDDGKCEAQCGALEDEVHLLAYCKRQGLQEARAKWTKAVRRKGGRITPMDAVGIVALDRAVAPEVTQEKFERATMDFLHDVAKARFGNWLV